MAEATFTLRAVDSTKAAFASVQNSLSRLEKGTASIAKFGKNLLGGSAVVATMTMLKGKIDQVVASSDEMGMSDEQILSAMRFQNAIESVLNFIVQIPVALTRMGFALGEMTGILKETDLQKQLGQFRKEQSAKEIKSLGETVVSLKEEFDSMGQTAGAAFDKVTANIKKLEDAMGAVDESKPLERAKIEVELAKAYNVERRLGLDLSEKITEAQAELARVLPESQRVGVARPELIKILRDKISEQAIAQKDLNVAMAAYQQFGGPVGQTQEKILKLTKEQVATTGQLNKLTEESSKIFMDAGGIIAQGFEDAILSGQKLGEVVRALGQDLLRLVFRQQITAPLAKGIGDALFAGFRAEGGPVGAGGAYVVGEKGPELFVPSSSGSIVPNGAMSSSGGGSGGVTVNYNIAAGVSRAELVPILEQERKRLKAEIPDMVRRGGSYRAAFA
jgi:hypothetical protein